MSAMHNVESACCNTLGLWGPAVDTVTVCNNNAPVPSEVQPRTIDWQPHNAPHLRNVFLIIIYIHSRMPRYCLLKTSCYTFGQAIFEAIYTAFNGHQHPVQETFFTRRSHFLGFPVGIARAERLAQEVAELYPDQVGLL